MKILHTSDWHLGNYVGPQCDSPMGRMANAMNCLDALVETARNEPPDIILVAGDIFHQARVWSERALTEVRVAAGYLNTLSLIAPVCLLYGTPNHDGEAQFEALEDMLEDKTVYFFRRPHLARIPTKEGLIQIASLPGFDKGHFRAEHPGLSAEEENRFFTQQLAAIVEGLSAQVDPEIPSVLMAHHTVVGCELDNGEHIFQANEVVLEAATLDNSNFDLVCLGHIHKAQKVEACSKPVYYAGSIDSFTFNDEGHEKGFWCHGTGSNGKHTFVETPAREFQTFRFDQGSIAGLNQYGPYFFGSALDFKNKVVRVLYTCDSETEKALDKKRLERDLYAAGAYYVSEIRPEKIYESMNRERMHETLTVEDCLTMYLKEKGYTFQQAVEILTVALPIIESIQASQPAGGQTGIFLPVEISVKNYRSYAEETLSFNDIHFAMVNGVNGSGKSSLFMDAPLDCLYEQPREGDLTGWIRSGEKSGSISFTFMLGGSTYRVTRTRQRSGKATLAIAKQTAFGGVDLSAEAGGGSFPFEQWEDISCERMIDTQNKIVDLLGMDADTFRSCVLIMQDQYGRFMEAKPEDRMSVLSSLLGLGMYEQLEELTKESLRDTNRELKNLKDDVSVLEAEVSTLETARELEKDVKKLINDKQCIAEGLKVTLDEYRTKLAGIENAEMELLQVDRDIQRKDETLSEKQNKLSGLELDIEVTEIFLEKETELVNAYTEYQKLQAELIAFNEQEKQADDKRRQLDLVKVEISNLDEENQKLRADISELQKKVDKLPEMLDEMNELNGIEHQLEEMERKKVRHEELIREKQERSHEVRMAEDKVARLKRQTEMLQVVQCVDIERAQCAFLKEAKDAAGTMAEAEHALDKRKGLLDDIEHEITALNYNPETYLKLTQDVRRYRELKQTVQFCESDKRMIELKSERIFAIESAVEEKKSIRTKLHEELLSLEINLGNINSIRRKLDEMSGLVKKYEQLPAAKQYVHNAMQQVSDLNADIQNINAEIAGLLGKKRNLQDGLKDADEFKQAKMSLEYQLSELEGELSGFMKQLGSIEEKLRNLEGKQEQLQETIKAVNDTAGKAAKLQVLTEAFGQDGIPHQIVRDIVPELEASANEILGQMTGGRMRLEFRTERQLKSNKAKEVATLDIVIIDVDNGELPYLARSGGQKVRAALAVSFALAMVKASRVGLQLGMMFVDEPPFLDAEGTEAYCMALGVIHEKYPDMRIVAISHDPEMKARFPQQISIMVGENGSKVRWE